MIRYETEGTSIYAVSYDAEFNGYLHSDLFWAEIDPALGGVMVRFEDSYNNPIHFATLVEAKTYIERNYFKHTPLSQGSKTYLG